MNETRLVEPAIKREKRVDGNIHRLATPVLRRRGYNGGSYQTGKGGEFVFSPFDTT